MPCMARVWVWVGMVFSFLLLAGKCLVHKCGHIGSISRAIPPINQKIYHKYIFIPLLTHLTHQCAWCTCQNRG
ncbi:hypothetical protein [Moraxella lacunata]|uniref:hypothetical protein n=1 Tax=Moraxella lacunata TaxID=477 RepID=UPI003EE3D828